MLNGCVCELIVCKVDGCEMGLCEVGGCELVLC